MFTEPKRRMVAIASADVAGYSRLMGDDEKDTVETLNRARDIFRQHIESADGRIVDTAGDNVLAVFDSVVEAVETVLEIQHQIRRMNSDRPESRHMLFRVGINLGDILEQSDGTIYGDGVNIAARVQTLAEPGGLTISGPAYDFIGDRGGLAWSDQGEHDVKNIARPVRVYAHREPGSEAPAPESARAEKSSLIPATPPQPARPSIAVLPFNNMSGDAEDEYFADGITEDIITELSRFRELIVTARNTTFSYKGKAVNVQDVGRELNVRYILEGSVRKAGNRVRVSAQLIKAAKGHHLWAERFDRKLEDVFEVQDELTRRIVSTLVGRLQESERMRARLDSVSESTAAYDLTLRGRELWLKFNRSDNLAARGLYLQAIKTDPDFARAYAGIAWTFVTAYNEYWTDDPQGALNEALEYAQRAVHMDPSSHSFRLCLSVVYYFRKNLDMSIECGEKALELNVNDADCYTFLAQSLSLNGEAEKAIELLDHAFEINPFLGDWAQTLYIVAYFNARRYADALTIIEKLTAPRASNQRWIGATHAMLGNTAEAQRAARAYFEEYPDFDLSEHLARVPFSHEADREHYAAALRRAGFERELATTA